MESDEKIIDILKQKMVVQKEKLRELENKFKNYLNGQNKSRDIFSNISKSLEMLSQDAKMAMKSEDATMNEILIVDSLSANVNKIISEITLKIRDSFEIHKISDIKQDTNIVAIPPKESKISAKKNIITLIGNLIISMIIKNNGKTIYCHCQDDGNFICNCFYRVDQAMKPKSGIYKIKMKVDQINQNIWNVIGITSNTHKTNNSQSKDKWFKSRDYIAWSTTNRNQQFCPNGFLCGTSECEENNIFVLNKFKYVSNNNYKQCAAGLKDKDVVILIYDSDLNILSLLKENDSSFDAKLINSPKNQTFFWFVAHFKKNMSITIV